MIKKYTGFKKSNVYSLYESVDITSEDVYGLYETVNIGTENVYKLTRNL